MLLIVVIFITGKRHTKTMKWKNTTREFWCGRGGPPAEPQTMQKGRTRQGDLSLCRSHGALGSGVSGAMAQLSHLLPPQEVPDAHGWGRSSTANLWGPLRLRERLSPERLSQGA